MSATSTVNKINDTHSRQGARKSKSGRRRGRSNPSTCEARQCYRQPRNNCETSRYIIKTGDEQEEEGDDRPGSEIDGDGVNDHRRIRGISVGFANTRARNQDGRKRKPESTVRGERYSEMLR